MKKETEEIDAGYSEITRIKQKHLTEILDTHIRICKSILEKKVSKYPKWAYPYYTYMDIYAGPGRINGYIGSPMIFIDLVKKYGIPYEAFFIENNHDQYDRLNNNILSKYGELPNHHLIFGDNKTELKLFIDSPPSKKQFGLLYADPKGIPNFNIIAKISKLSGYDKLDILINCPATAQKRTLKNSRCHLDKNLAESLLSINKSYWIIREPYGHYQWTFLIGTNWDSFPEFNHLGFHRLTSNKGREIFLKLIYTNEELGKFESYGFYQSYEEYLDHPIFQFIRKEVFARANNICEECKMKIAKEPHHLFYPHWGTFYNDGPGILKVVCHQCHCKLHGKEN